MSAKRYTAEFKVEAVKQVVERNYKISDVASRLGVTPKSLHSWIDKSGKPESQHKANDANQSKWFLCLASKP